MIWLAKTETSSDPVQPMKSLVKKAITQATVRVYYGWSGNRQTWTDLKFWDTSWRVNVRGKYLKISFLFGRLRTALSHVRWSLVCFWFYAWRGYPRRRQFHVSTVLFSIFVVKIRDRTQNKLVAIHGGHNRVGFHLKIWVNLFWTFEWLIDELITFSKPLLYSTTTRRGSLIN